MKRICSLLLTLALVLGLAACAQKAPTWQEQYDLGVKYLSEGNYEEAVIAFTAAIEIDPKRPEAFVGRGDAYVGSGETADSLAAALADYENAIALDETIAEAWLGLADVYIRQGEYDKALEALKDGLVKTGNNEKIAQKLANMEAGTFADRDGKTRKSVYIENGEVIQYWLYEYDENGNNVKTTNYKADDTWNSTAESEFDSNGLEIQCVENHVTGGTTTTTFEYDSQRRCTKQYREEYGPEHHNSYYTIISYDNQLNTETHDEYRTLDGTDELLNRFVIEFDENGVRHRGSSYLPDENGELYLDYYVEYIWNEDGSYGGFEHVQVAPVE